MRHYIKKNHRALVSFLIIGASTAALYFLLFTFFWKMLGIHYSIAVSLAYILSVTFQFFANRSLTFKSHSHRLLPQATRFAVLLGINYLITIIIVRYVVEKCLLSPYIGVILSVFVTVITGFLLSRLWVFKEHKKSSNKEGL